MTNVADVANRGKMANAKKLKGRPPPFETSSGALPQVVGSKREREAATAVDYGSGP